MKRLLISLILTVGALILIPSVVSATEPIYDWVGGKPVISSDEDEWVGGKPYGVIGTSEAPSVVAPTVTTQAASNIEATTATGNGNITATGGEDCTARGFEWDTDSGAPYANTVSTSGTYSTGAFTGSLTSLPTGTTIYYRAFATNSAGTGYGSEESFLTKPAAPTAVSATDGTHTDKVVVTWTKSTGATGYRVYQDDVDVSGLLGDVATYDDTDADAGTITPGAALASDATSLVSIYLSLSGQSANNGTTHTYKVVAVNATGNSADSSTDTGYRGVGSLEYQWQVSAGDSDADYSDIAGAETASYTYTGDSPRYFKCVLDATGAAQATSTADRGRIATGLNIVKINGIPIFK